MIVRTKELLYQWLLVRGSLSIVFAAALRAGVVPAEDQDGVLLFSLPGSVWSGYEAQ